MNTEEVVARHERITSTQTTKVAAGLITLGCRPRRVKPVSNIYTAQRPFERKDVPGRVFYHFEASPVETVPGSPTPQKLAEEWERNAAHTEFDEMFAALKSELVKRDACVKEITALEKMFAPAIMCYMRAGMENRERILDWWRKAIPMEFKKRGGKAWSLVHANPSPNQTSK